jgi:hypothetical protein
MMRGVSLALSFLVYSIDAGRVPRFEEPEANPLASFLLASNPTAALQRSGTRFTTGSSHRAGRQFATRSPMMQDTAADPAPPLETPKFDVREMAGVTAPLGFFDPLGFSTGASETKIRFYRECELKHGRVAMLASLGYLIAEQFHPLFGGNIDVPSLKAFQQTPLQSYWAIAVGIPLLLAIPEVFSVFTFEPPTTGKFWEIKKDHEPGNLGFDPLGLKPKDPKGLKEMQTKELNNGRLAMIAFAGMVYQEVATGAKLF